MTKIDLNRVRQLNKKLNPQIMGINLDPGLEEKGYLFYYKNRYYFSNGAKMVKLSESEAAAKLEPTNLIEIHFLCSEKICPMPTILSGERMENRKVKDDGEACRYMTRKGKVLITKNDL